MSDIPSNAILKINESMTPLDSQFACSEQNVPNRGVSVEQRGNSRDQFGKRPRREIFRYGRYIEEGAECVLGCGGAMIEEEDDSLVGSN